jgi:hypothetical protein
MVIGKGVWAAVAVAIAVLGLAAPLAATTPDRLSQAQANYRAVVGGTKQIGDLSPQELADLAELDRRLREEKRDTRSLSQRCIDDEVRRAGGSPSTLERRIIDMKCREAGD